MMFQREADKGDEVGEAVNSAAQTFTLALTLSLSPGARGFRFPRLSKPGALDCIVRWIRFSLSSGERAGVRADVHQFKCTPQRVHRIVAERIFQVSFQLLQHPFREPLLVSAAVKNLQRRDLGFVLLDVVSE